MPFQIKRQNCINSEGKNGSYVVFDTARKRTVSCHKERGNAMAAARIRITESKDLTAEQKRNALKAL